jgi:hypothetical protein
MHLPFTVRLIAAVSGVSAPLLQTRAGLATIRVIPESVAMTIHCTKAIANAAALLAVAIGVSPVALIQNANRISGVSLATLIPTVPADSRNNTSLTLVIT